jgi:hypothetical protein
MVTDLGAATGAAELGAALDAGVVVAVVEEPPADEAVADVAVVVAADDPDELDPHAASTSTPVSKVATRAQ